MGLKDKVVEWAIRRELDKQKKEKTMMGKVWEWLSGKKLVIGSLLTLVASLVDSLPVLLPLFVTDAGQVAGIVGVGVTIVGLLHKLYKFCYKEDHK